MEEKNDKQTLGQFYTTNYEYILRGLNIPNDVKKIIEPFAGNGDLINYINKWQEEIKCEFDLPPL